MPRKGQSQPWRLIDEETYWELVETYRKNPGKYTLAARTVGVSRPTATKAWQKGFPDRSLPPIRVVINGERIIARAERNEKLTAAEKDAVLEHSKAMARLDRRNRLLEMEGIQFIPTDGDMATHRKDMAREDSIRTRVEEGQILKFARSNTARLMATASKLITTALDRSKDLEEKVKAGKVEMEPEEVVRFTKTCAYIARTLSEASKMNMDMERMLLGDPGETMDITVSDMSLDDARRVIEIANRRLNPDLYHESEIDPSRVIDCHAEDEDNGDRD